MTFNFTQQQELHEILLEMFDDFCRICDANGLSYYLIGGSCLGAVRHKGFIPWDDDIDIGMLRKDYDTFNLLASSQLSEGLFLQNIRTDTDYYHEFCKIRNSKTTYIETGLSKLNINHGVFIDIFPLDYVPDTITGKLNFRIKRAMYDNYIAEYYMGKAQNASVQKKIMSLIAKVIIKDISVAKKERDQLLRKVSSKPTDLLANYYGAWAKKEIVPADYFADGTKAKFEGRSVSIPRNFDAYLTQLYGDYMQLPPEHKRVSHHACIIIDFHIPYTQYIGNIESIDLKSSGDTSRDK